MDKLKLYNYQPTSNPDVFRYVDHNGDWDRYYIKSKDKYVPAVNRILQIGFPKGPAFYNYLLSVSKKESEEILDRTGERGSRLHTAFKMYIAGESLTIDTLLPNQITGRPEKIIFDEWLAILALDKFCEVYKPQTVSNEETVATDEYAGTLDWISVIEVKGKFVKVLWDFKTGGGIYADYKAQTAAYYFAKNDKTIQATGIIRLGTKHKNGYVKNAGYEVKLWDKKETKRHYIAFLAAKNLHDLETPEFEKDDTEIPSQVQRTIPIYMPSVKKTSGKSKSPMTGEVKTKNVTTKLSNRK